MSTLLKTSFTDPGIIPRATADEAMYIEKQISEKIYIILSLRSKWYYVKLFFQKSQLVEMCPPNDHLLERKKFLFMVRVSNWNIVSPVKYSDHREHLTVVYVIIVLVSKVWNKLKMINS